MSELFTLDTLQEFWASRPEGARLQFRTYPNKDNWNTVTNAAPELASNPDNWRWEPQSIPVDLSSLVGSDVLFEFGHGIKRFGFLKAVINGTGFVDQDDNLWKQCKPVMNKWMAVGIGLSIPEGLGHEETYFDRDIKLVKFNGLKEGYHWPWEDK